MTIFRRVVLLNLTPAILDGTSLSFARAFSEFGSTVLISGNLPFKTEVAAVHIFSQIQSDNPTAAPPLSTVLLMVALVVLVASNLIHPWPTPPAQMHRTPLPSPPPALLPPPPA